MLTLLYGLHCTFHLLRFNFTFVLLAHLYVFNTWYYCIFSNNTQDSYFKINLGQMAKSRGNRAEVQRGKIALLNHFGMYELSIHKNSWKNDCKKNAFFYRKRDLMLKRRNEAIICENTVFLCNNCNCFYTFFSCFVKLWIKIMK